jgi:hypothetical protein
VSQSPAVMVSSTYYDLKHLRANLRQALEDDLGYRALLSEHSSFPIDPDLDTVSNCRRRVSDDADILVLVIGGRYGYVDKDTSKSVTNLEYLTAREKGIPIYVFVEERVLNLLNTWVANPNADFSADVDNPKLFEFVKDIRTNQRIWVRGFRDSAEIVQSIKTQLAYLFRDSLKVRQEASRNNKREILKSLRPAAYRIALEQPPAWEWRLFSQVLLDAMEDRAALRREHRARWTIGPAFKVENLFDWVRERMHELTLIVDACNKLVNDHFQTALGAPGVAGDAEQLIWVAQRLGDGYGELLNWDQRILRTNPPKGGDDVLKVMPVLAEQLITEFEEFAPHFAKAIERALLAPEGSPERHVEMTLHFRMDKGNLLTAEIEKYTRRITGGS